MERKQFQIGIKTDFDSSGVDKAGASLTKMRGGMEAVNRVALAINQALPGLGTAMMAVFNPVTAVALAAIAVFTHFTDKVEQINEELKRLNDGEALKHINRLHEEATATGQVSVALADLDRKLQNAANSEQTLSARTSEAVSASRDQFEAAREIGDAQTQLDLSQAALRNKLGLSSTAEYEAQKIAIAEAAAERRRAIAEEELLAEIDIRAQMIEAAKKSANALKSDAEQKIAASVQAQQKAKRAEEVSSQSSTALAAASSAVKAFEIENKNTARFEALGVNAGASEIASTAASVFPQVQGLRPGGYIAVDLRRRGFVEDYQTWQKLKTAEAQAQKAFESAPQAAARANIDAATAAAEADIARARLTSNEESIFKGAAENDARRAELDARKKTNVRLNEIGRAQAAVDYSTWAADQATSLGKMDDLTLGQFQTARDAQRGLYGTGPAPSGGNTAAASAYVDKMIAANSQFFSAVAAQYEQRMKLLADQVRNSR